MPEQLRLFVAIELPLHVQNILAETQATLRDRSPAASAIRWVDPAGIHLTLKFLGEVPALRLDSIQSAISAAVEGHTRFDARLHGLGCFPHTRRPRVLWAGLEEPNVPLQKLQSAIEDALNPLGFAAEKRPFQPHLTLGRAQRNAATARLQQMGDLVAKSGLHAQEAWHVDGVSLMESVLHRSGAEYRQRMFAPLKP